MKIRRIQSGFTLLELTLATAIIAMLGLTLYACMNIGFRARSVVRNQVSEMREASIVMEVLRQDFQSVSAPTEDGLAGTFIGRTDGTGSRETSIVQFFAFGSDGDDRPLSDGIRRITLSLDNAATVAVLVRSVQRNLLASTEQPPEEEILARNVRAFSARYFDGTTWLAEWDSAQMGNTIPLAVALSIELTPASGPDPIPYRLAQIIPLSCGRIPEDTETTGTGATQ